MEKNKRPYNDYTLYEDGDVCPVCGGKIKHPYTGAVTSEQLEEDSKSCIWIEVVDENDCHEGYHAICHNIHPYTLDEEDHKYVHYDMVELVNCWWENTLAEKIDKILNYVTGMYNDIKKEDIIVETEGDKIINIRIAQAIHNMVIDMHVNDDGTIRLDPQ